MRFFKTAAGTITLVIASASLAFAGLTPEQKCQDAIAGAAGKYFGARYKALENAATRAPRPAFPPTAPPTRPY